MRLVKRQRMYVPSMETNRHSAYAHSLISARYLMLDADNKFNNQIKLDQLNNNKTPRYI